MLKNAGKWILLSMVPQLGPIGCRRLLESFGSPEGIFSAAAKELAKIPGIREKTISFITTQARHLDISSQLRWIKENKIKLLTPADAGYPPNLINIYDPPFLLYVKGELKEEDEKAVAIVGTRRCTIYGKITARRLARDIARQGITIVSGMARGIDTAAHQGALEVSGRTVAVLGCGLDIVYPRENRKLMEEISRSGAVISEFPPGTRPEARNFPRRNRIISGLSLGVVVVEAPSHSGALITADFALEQGREVFAVPGNISGPYSKGTNRLIKEGAKLIEKDSDVLEELNLFFSGENEPQKSLLDLSEEEKEVFQQLSQELRHIDELIKECSFPPGKVGEILMKLQIKGLVRELPGKMFVANQ